MLTVHPAIYTVTTQVKKIAVKLPMKDFKAIMEVLEDLEEKKIVFSFLYVLAGKKKLKDAFSGMLDNVE